MILESLHLIKAYSARAMNYLESYSISKVRVRVRVAAT